MPTAPLSAGQRQYHPNNRRPQHRSSTAGRRAVSTSRLDLLARPRSTLLHAATAASPATGTHNAKKSPPPVTIPSNELRKSAKARSLSHLNKDTSASASAAAAPRPSNPVTRRATTVGSGVAVEKKSRPRRAPPAARSSGRNNDQQETLLRLPTRGGGVCGSHAWWCGLLSQLACRYVLGIHPSLPVTKSHNSLVCTICFARRLCLVFTLSIIHEMTNTSFRRCPSSNIN